MPVTTIFDVSFADLADTDTDRDRLVLRDIMGHTVVIVPHEYVPALETSNGVTDCVRADVHDITNERSYYDQLLFQRVIVNGLKGKINVNVLGVVGRGPSKRGKTAPLILRPATEGRRERAARYLRRLEDQTSAS